MARRVQGDENITKTRTIPLLPLRDIVFPIWLFRSLLDEISHQSERRCQATKCCWRPRARRRSETEHFLHRYHRLVIQLLKLPDGTVKVLIEGKRRAKVIDYLETEDVFRVVCETVEPIMPDSAEISALISQVRETFESYVKLNKRIPPEMQMTVEKISDPGKLADTIVAHLNLKLNDKQTILETENPAERLEKLFEFMRSELEILQVEKKIRSRVKKQMESQKEYYLNEQMQRFRRNSVRDQFKNELKELEDRIKKKDMSAEAKARVKKELKKLKMMSPMSAEATVVKTTSIGYSRYLVG